MNRKLKKLILIIVVLVGLYISAYAAFRVLGFYQWKHTSVTRRYYPSEKRFTEVYNYDLISVTAPWWGLVYKLKPVFLPVAKLECVLIINRRPHPPMPPLSEAHP